MTYKTRLTKPTILDEHQIMDLMAPIKYGWLDKFGVKHHQVNQTFSENYRLQNPEQVLKNKIGVCWDQVELERFLFNQINLKIKTFFIVHYDNDKYPTHTFLVFQKNKSYFWFEHSWTKHQGIHKFNNLKDLLSDVKNKFISDEPNDNFKSKKLCIYEYFTPRFNISQPEFFHHCEHGKPTFPKGPFLP